MEFISIIPVNRSGYLCIKCNFTIHTKYCRTDTDPTFNPTVNLQCLDKILIVANGLIHMIHIDLHMNKQIKPYTNSIDVKYVRTRTKSKPDTSQPDKVNENLTVLSSCSTTKRSNLPTKTTKERPNSSNVYDDQKVAKNPEPKNIVEKIIADFAECETDSMPIERQPHQQSQLPRTNTTQNNFNELVITCRNNVDKPLKSTSSTKVRLLNHRSNRIISKSVTNLKNSITKVDFGGTQATNPTIPGGSSNSANKNLDKAAKAYEFSEDNEKCEKISTFRKRRLADKKYEFSEDNTENIIPYNRMRSVIRNPTLHQKISRHSSAQSNVMSFSSSPPSTFEITSYHTHRASPSYGFRSPCGSPVGNRFHMMSPPGKY